MNELLMPMATAVWLIKNTSLTFNQIADFCNLHPLEVQSIADDEVAPGMIGFDPISAGQLTQEEIDRCTADPNEKISLAPPKVPIPAVRSKGPRYTPVARRQDRPDAIAWLVRTFPDLTDAQIARLIGTTKPTIIAVRDCTHWNTPNIKPRDPIALGLCTRADLDEQLARAERVRELKEKREAKERTAAQAAAPSTAETATAEAPSAEASTAESVEAPTESAETQETAEAEASADSSSVEPPQPEPENPGPDTTSDTAGTFGQTQPHEPNAAPKTGNEAKTDAASRNSWPDRS